MNRISIRVWVWITLAVLDVRVRLRDDERGLTTTEWALLVAGVAALAIVVVAVVRNLTADVTKKIPDNVDVNTGSGGFRS